jgi:hypothetical protein
MTSPPPPVSPLLIANRSGHIVGQRVVQSALVPVRSATLLSRQNIGFMVGAAAVLAGITVLQMFDEAEVNDTLGKWETARKYIDGTDDNCFVKELDKVIGNYLPAEAWSAPDREAFDDFIKYFKNEAAAIATALDLNRQKLERARDLFHAAADQLAIVLGPVLLLMIAAVALQFTPPPGPSIAMAIGVAGSSIAIAVIGSIFGFLATALAQVGTALYRGNSAVVFNPFSRPGDLPLGAKDTDLNEIVINWVQTPDFYKDPPK